MHNISKNDVMDGNPLYLVPTGNNVRRVPNTTSNDSDLVAYSQFKKVFITSMGRVKGQFVEDGYNYPREFRIGRVDGHIKCGDNAGYKVYATLAELQTDQKRLMDLRYISNVDMTQLNNEDLGKVALLLYTIKTEEYQND